MARPNPVVRAKLQKLAPDALAAIDPFAPSAMADPFASLDAFCKMQPKAEDETPCECKSKELEGGKLAAPFAGVALAEVLCRETDHSDNDHGWRFVVAKTSAVGPRAGSASTTTRCGARPEAALVITTTSGVLGLFYHWNIATPHWLGYVVQRPESHCIHHQQDVHAYNYSELPLIDIVFGTFQNPRRFVGQCGLGAGREQRFAALLLGHDVTQQG